MTTIERVTSSKVERKERLRSALKVVGVGVAVVIAMLLWPATPFTQELLFDLPEPHGPWEPTVERWEEQTEVQVIERFDDDTVITTVTNPGQDDCVATDDRGFTFDFAEGYSGVHEDGRQVWPHDGGVGELLVLTAPGHPCDLARGLESVITLDGDHAALVDAQTYDRIWRARNIESLLDSTADTFIGANNMVLVLLASLPRFVPDELSEQVGTFDVERDADGAVTRLHTTDVDYELTIVWE